RQARDITLAHLERERAELCDSQRFTNEVLDDLVERALLEPSALDRTFWLDASPTSSPPPPTSSTARGTIGPPEPSWRPFVPIPAAAAARCASWPSASCPSPDRPARAWLTKLHACLPPDSVRHSRLVGG